MTDPLHVAPGIVGILDAPNHVRIRAIRTERWIGFARARGGFEANCRIEGWWMVAPEFLDQHSLPHAEQRVILQLFRHLSNELKASLVCLGVADARDAIAGDVQLARRLDQLVLPRWKGDEEFQEMVTAILRSLPLKRPSVLSAQGLRHLVRMADGITARVFGVLNELAIDAVETGAERISDTVIETWKPAIEKEAAFA
jgi:hypothetical protein